MKKTSLLGFVRKREGIFSSRDPIASHSYDVPVPEDLPKAAHRWVPRATAGTGPASFSTGRCIYR
jgi:hypothetical protein